MLLSPRVQKILRKFEAQHLLRKRDAIDKKKLVVSFSSNDYLNIAKHPDVIKAYQHGAEECGLGSGAAPLVSGYTKSHQQLEEAFAEFLNRDKALLLNSGYHANLGVITTFADRSTTVIADKLCHASLIDGIVLSRAKHKRYHHHDMSQAERLLREHQHQDTLLITESVFSMQGDIANVKKLSALAKNNQALLIVDDAHGIGVLGNRGGGICDYYQLSQQEVPCLITPFGKALGSFGAMVTGKADLIEALVQCARTYRYSTALPPAVCQATLAALKILTHESWRRSQLQHLITFFITEAKSRNLPLASFDATPIKSVVIGSNKATLDMQTKLMASGFFVSCIRPPTVPVNQACVRLSLNCTHTEEQIIRLLDLMAEHHEFKN
jgi:8-amino-7-oxononanoate synthase